MFLAEDAVHSLRLGARVLFFLYVMSCSSRAFSPSARETAAKITRKKTCRHLGLTFSYRKTAPAKMRQQRRWWRPPAPMPATPAQNERRWTSVARTTFFSQCKSYELLRRNRSCAVHKICAFITISLYFSSANHEVLCRSSCYLEVSKELIVGLKWKSID